MTRGKFVLKSPCKINLSLEVSHDMTGGYHQIRSVFQAIDFSDYIEFSPGNSLRLTMDQRSSVSFGTERIEDNLIINAAELLATELSIYQGAHISLQKHIPLSSGVGGGSSNAATTLVGLNRLWDLNLSLNDLMGFAEKLGSDVPFFLTGGTSLVSGVGSDLHQLPSNRMDWVLLVFPEESLAVPNKTSRMYKLFDEAGRSGSDFGYHSSVISKRIIAGLKVGDYLFNSFEEVMSSGFAGYREFKEKIEFLTKEKFSVTGSGPGLFIITTEYDYGVKMKEVLETHGVSVVLCRFLPKWA